MDRKSGKVKFYLSDKGFGFIETEERDYFVHKTNIKTETQVLYKAQKVSFSLVDTEKGPMAVEVTLED